MIFFIGIKPFVIKKGEKYSEQVDVKEVQIEGAKIVLKYIGNKNNNVKISSQTKKYLKAYKHLQDLYQKFLTPRFMIKS